jgi:hypothetical protein
MGNPLDYKYSNSGLIVAAMSSLQAAIKTSRVG